MAKGIWGTYILYNIYIMHFRKYKYTCCIIYYNKMSSVRMIWNIMWSLYSKHVVIADTLPIYYFI